MPSPKRRRADARRSRPEPAPGPYARPVAGIIDGRQWVKQRLEHLRGLLEANPTDEQRKAIEAEIAALEPEATASRRRFRRWLIWGGRP